MSSLTGVDRADIGAYSLVKSRSGLHLLDKDLRQLEHRIDDLIGACRRLKDENDSLRSSRDTLLEEKSKLAEKNRMARNRLETIVNRLRTLEKR